MTFDDFKASLTSDAPPQVAPLLIALWHEAHGEWDRAHELAQDIDTSDGAWVHAYLHRREGDAWNARYWYTRAGQRECATALEDEWADIAGALLTRR